MQNYGQCGQSEVFTVTMEAFEHGTQFWCFEERAGNPGCTFAIEKSLYAYSNVGKIGPTVSLLSLGLWCI